MDYDPQNIVAIDTESVAEFAVYFNDTLTTIRDLPELLRSKYIYNFDELSKFERNQIHYKSVLATVSIVRLSDMRIMCSERVRRQPGSFRFIKKMLKNNHIRPHSLKYGNIFHEVKQRVLDIIMGKLVITVAERIGFEAIDLKNESNSIDHFDLVVIFIAGKLIGMGTL